MTMKSETSGTDQLIICYKFPPVSRVSGVVLAKRVIANGETVDLIQGPIKKDEKDEDFNRAVEEFIDNRIIIESDKANPTWSSIEEFNEKGMMELEKLDKIYKTIKSRAGSHESHFLALEYKFKHPESYWVAEFSDPLSITIENIERGLPSNKQILVKDCDYIDRINEEIKNLNRRLESDFRLITKEDKIFYLCEYLPFLFADEILFTNENQMDIMLDLYPKEVGEMVRPKAKVSHHPTLDEKYYHMVESDYELDGDCINFGYFGTYLGRRHLESLYYAFETLHPKVKDKYRIHIFTQEKGLLNSLIGDLKIHENIIVNDKLPLLEFLNISTKFDVLIVNDLNTYDNFSKNPFLPSKLSDYLGSNRDIWAIYEKGSVMSTYDLKYKSDVSEYLSSLNTLKQIFTDKLDLEREGIDLDDIDDNPYEFMERRIYQLNYAISKEQHKKGNLNKRNKKLKNENKKLKKEIKSIKATKGWIKYKTKNIYKRTVKK